MTVYEYIETALTSWATTNGFALRAEVATLSDGSLPDKYILYSIVDDIHGGYADNRARNIRTRIQFDIAVHEDDRSKLRGYFDLLEPVLIGAKLRPQGNYRMAYEDASQIAYIQKDYILFEKMDSRWDAG